MWQSARDGIKAHDRQCECISSLSSSSEARLNSCCTDWSPLTFTLDEASGIELPEQFHWRDWFLLDVA